MTQPTNVKAVAARLHEAREFLNLSRSLVSERLGLSIETLEELEQGSRAPTNAELAQFATLYRLSVAFIRTGKDDAEVGEATERAFKRAVGELSERERTNVERFALFLQNFRRE